MMRKLSVRELREELARLDRVIEREGEVLITRHGAPVARLLPVKTNRKRPDHADLRCLMPRPELKSEDWIRLDRDER
jgi:prevent-host-death family protein